MRTYAAILVVILLLILSYLIFKPYLGAILISIVLAMVFHPVYKRLLKYVKIPSISSTITVIIALIVIIIPVAFFGFIVGKEFVTIYQSGFVESANSFVSSVLSSSPVVSKVAENVMDRGILFLTDLASSILLDIPNQLLQLVIIIFMLFSLFLTGSSLSENVKRLIPFKNKDVLIRTIKDHVNAIIYGFIVISIIVFIIAVVGLYALGIPNYLLWSIVIAFLVLIPFLGPIIFWLPYSVYLFLNGDIGTGIGLIIFGMFLSGIETFGRPYFIGKRVDIHPIAVFIGVLGGLPLFGIAGLIIGPVVLSITFILLEEMIRG